MPTALTGYRALRADDGTLVVPDVPVFAECERDGTVYDAAWLAAAFKNARVAAADKHFPPLHLRHHGPGDDVEAAGFFEVTRIGPIVYKGAARLALFADLTFTNPEAAEMVLSRRFPYRSVELDPGKSEVFGLALLDHDAPYLELPMLMIGDVDEVDELKVGPWQVQAMSRGPVVACFSRAGRATVRFLFEDPMSKKPGSKSDKSTVHMEADGDEKKPKKDGEGDEEKMEEGGASLDPAPFVAAIKSGEISVGTIDEIEMAIAEYRASVAAKSAETTDVPANVPGAAVMDRASAELAGQNRALMGRVAALENERKRDREVAEAMGRLRNWPLGDLDKLETEMVEFHKAHPTAFNDYVDAIIKHASKFDEGDGDATATARFARAADTPAEALEYEAQGTEAVAKAASFAREWETQRAFGLKSPLKTYLRGAMLRAGFSAPVDTASA